MSIILSVATSEDGYIDDSSQERLLLSSSEDWEQVYKLRAGCDAILIGGGTLRSDNPTLTLKSEELKSERRECGRSAEPVRVVVSGRGEINPDMRIFHKGEGRIIIFSNIERGELGGVAEVIVCESITPAIILGELERRGIYNIFVEGGEQILTLFLQAKMVDTLRVARNPYVVVADPSAPRFELPEWIKSYYNSREALGEVEVDTYIINRGCTERDSRFMEQAIEVSHSSPKSEGCYSVGAVIVASGEIITGYTGEVKDSFHAEQAAIYKAEQRGVNLYGATIYSTIEPCSQRSRFSKSCSQLILESGFARVCFALYEPSCFVKCNGAARLREAGVRVDVMSEYIEEVMSINAHLLEK